MKISVFFDHILEAEKQTGKSIDEIACACKDWGIEALELNYSYFCEHRDELMKTLDHSGLGISCFYETFNFAQNSSEESDDMKRALQLLADAEKLGVSRFLAVAGELPKEEADELNSLSGSKEKTCSFMKQNTGVQRIRTALTRLSEAAAQKKVILTLEDFDGPVQPFSRRYQLLYFMESVPGLSFTLDSGNFAYSGEDVLEAQKLLKNYIAHVHCKDRKEGSLDCCPTGSGRIPLPQILDALISDGYDSYLAIEHFGLSDQLSGIRESAQFLKNYR